MFSVGVLYSCHTFLEMVKKSPVYSTGFTSMFQEFEVATAESVLHAAQLCEWTFIGPDGSLRITSRGEAVLAGSSPEARLRIQLSHMIACLRPNWIAHLSSGRFEATKALPDDARQCFEEAGLLVGYDSETLDWWDAAAGVARLVKDTAKNSGRLGERYSRAYESARVGAAPYWQGFESNFAGYDLLSQLDKRDGRRLLIEVKASQSRVREGSFFVTRNEWDTAVRSENYLFHLWALKPSPKLLIVPRTDLDTHVPVDHGEGKWRQTWIPMSPFSGREVSVETEVFAAA
jgi:hypothetical protein